ncbi:hypothetical protein MMC30_006599 [Trapelia coarctata]|nr:hypothetical protein [Trapelia coarctata]
MFFEEKLKRLRRSSQKTVLPILSNDPKVTREDLAEKPWKYAGYKNYSRFVGTSRSFFVTRQFRTLNVRVILAMQDQLTELEEDLNVLDNQLSCKDAEDIHNGSFRQESSRDRLGLIWSIQRKLKDYNEYLQSYTQIGTRSGVAARDIRSVEAWVTDHPSGILDSELQYVQSGDDLVYVLPKEKSPLRRIYNKAESLGLHWFRREPTDAIGYDPETTLLQEEERAEAVLSRVILLIGLLMLIGPLWILESVKTTIHSLAVITCFIVLFLFLVSFATAARPFESLAATAAYSAVLMNSNTLRRLAADHASLHKSELPPYYLFPPGTASMPDDLTQLAILLTGPQGTPYADGVWKLHLKIPLDYPKSPPKASFRTKIWHPNVEESTGSVCVDTLKRDWSPKLTLRDILITISCLLIHPNPDSALNSAAGQLLQEDFESFARQAKLMTSIHAVIPLDWRAPVEAAKRRGEDSVSGPAASKLFNSRKRPHLAIEPIPALPDMDSDGDDFDDEASASKENDPSISPLPVNPPAPSARRPTLQKRPLSDLPTPVESPTDDEDEACAGMTSSERNIAANTPNLSSNVACMSVSERSDRPIKLVERSRSFNFAWRGKDDAGASGLMITPFEDRSSQSSVIAQEMDMEQPAKKRVCSSEEFEEKENFMEVRPVLPTLLSKPLSVGAAPAKPPTGVDLRKVSSASGSGGSGSVRAAKPRVGLRRL